jgi:hypothetical protein
MPTTKSTSYQPISMAPSNQSKTGALAITDGEIHFLWWFIQGGITNPETRTALLRGFGFCERHAWAHLSVEMSFRKQHFLGPVILYRELIEKSAQAVMVHRHGLQPRLRRLQARAPCFLCALSIEHAGTGAAPLARLIRGRNSSGLYAFAADLAPLWRSKVCTICMGTREAIASPRCRPHLLADLNAHKRIDLSWQEVTLRELSIRLGRYEESFMARVNPPSDQDRAALISAIGWCSGWRPLLALLHN